MNNLKHPALDSPQKKKHPALPAVCRCQRAGSRCPCPRRGGGMMYKVNKREKREAGRAGALPFPPGRLLRRIHSFVRFSPLQESAAGTTEETSEARQAKRGKQRAVTRDSRLCVPDSRFFQVSFFLLAPRHAAGLAACLAPLPYVSLHALHSGQCLKSRR